ncbi:uncharacterized protein LOC105695067 [Orussus abietinus]|uniref:uncharacterized protein LOC105695067 n=1 Tax=Orussus abietinus TaxID=222816 RepID=UPI0006252058|nr:uncharacterized protein LOC105695067 [Orussus abietinus]
MAFQLDDLLNDERKGGAAIPDFSRATCNSEQELKRLLEQCPDYKIKPEKVRRENTKVRDKDFSWKITKRELKALEKDWGYGDPVPPDMRGLNLQELQKVPIDWRMLTPIRPKIRQDEDMFSRLVEMGKLELRTAARERRCRTSPIKRNKNRAGIIESCVKVCDECGEEFCAGESCGDILYEAFIRVTVSPQQQKSKPSPETAAIIAGMDDKKKTPRKKKRTPRKSVRLLVRKVRKPAKEGETEKRSKTERSQKDEEDEGEGKKKRFRRKCSKFGKKA